MREIIQIYDGMETLESLPLEEGSDEAASKKEEELIGYSAILNLNHGALYYSKRCMLAYLKERLDRIRQKRWAKGNVLTEQEQSLMSKEEVNYFQQYDSLLSSYMQHTEVTATCDYGEIVTTSGTINISCSILYASS
ncbi:uncharacterized protein [Blastocystis hominis]|uniref:GINS subunit domain-containing protein n=1 Tax=Blastocystis hominis TaxID=12968 RepID=D8M032_BLAHO|nr:uncharacterized protein [Blastocystis hominis]CBK21421.2 unnamed protein product [Blastocystis hominis]|eukprot:XP_012895469.1 uncharacterized protein [Blastocystis hominis]